MPQAQLTLTIPADIWIGEISRKFPAARFRILSALSDGDSGVGLVEIHFNRPEAVLSAMADRDQVTALTELKRQEKQTLVQFETSHPLLLLTVQDSGVPLEMPFELQDGAAVWELTAPTERLSALGDQLDAFGIPYSVEYVRQNFESDQLLTDKQDELVQTAIEMGYYDTPRDCSLTDVAEAVGIAKSTASETLHRAEGQITKEYAGSDDVPVERPA